MRLREAVGYDCLADFRTASHGEAVSCALITGDTKVVDRGKADRIFINTSGIGLVPPGVDVRPLRVHAGDTLGRDEAIIGRAVENGPVSVTRQG